MHRREFLKALAAVPVLAKILPRPVKEEPSLTIEEIVKASSDAQTYLTSTPSVVMSSEDKIFLLEPEANPLSLLLDKKRLMNGEYKFDWSE